MLQFQDMHTIVHQLVQDLAKRSSEAERLRLLIEHPGEISASCHVLEAFHKCVFLHLYLYLCLYAFYIYIYIHVCIHIYAICNVRQFLALAFCRY
jgi:hypothetical protein